MDKRQKIRHILPWQTRLGGLLLSIVLFLLINTNVSAQNIDRIEYFFDQDPGFGNGTAVSITPAARFDSLTFSVNIDTLSAGFHNLFIRARDDSSRWSMTNMRPFYKFVMDSVPANIVAMEYFFDQDPGYGNGTDVPLTPKSDVDSLNFTIDITSLSGGFHNLFLRVKDDDGKWSLNSYRSFYRLILPPVQPNVTDIEYFFDNDPGFGQGTAVSFTPQMNVDSLAFNIDITGLNDGFHRLFIRARDGLGKWSQTEYVSFYKLAVLDTIPYIVEAEYFLDNDPGYGNGIPISITPGILQDFVFNINLDTVSEGFHNLFIRMKDERGRWSHTAVKPFYRMILHDIVPGVTAVEYFFDNDPGEGNGTAVNFSKTTHVDFSFNVDISGLDDGFHMLMVRVQDSLGDWSHTNYRPFYKHQLPDTLPHITAVEYYFDSVPPPGQGISVPLNGDSTHADLNFSVNIDSLAEGFHMFHVRVKDSRGHWSLVSSRPFYKQVFHTPRPNIVEAEYFFDTDPGEGNGIDIPVTAGADVPFLAWRLNLDSLSFGNHWLYVRVKDEHGKWSINARDTIFYYIDTLPTASLSGPVGVCIFDTATFEVSLTGSAPWSIIVDNGFTTDTIDGIMQSPYLFDIVPQTAGHYTARVLQVSDVYYTGLYTGIPIEYDVHPFPDPAGSISGPTDICASNSVITFTSPRVANAVSYNWIVPAGATIINSGLNWYYRYPFVTVDFHGTPQSGQISITPVNACGMGTPSYLDITVHENPTVDAGLDQVIDHGDTAYLSATASGGAPPYSWSWSPYWAFIDHNVADPVFIHTNTRTVSATVTDTNGCGASDQVTIYVGPQSGATISGMLRYENASLSPMRSSEVYLLSNYAPVDTAQTDNSGNFSFEEVTTGHYALAGSTTLPWGGVNATDALLILKHFVDSINFSGLKADAADVMGNGYVNAIDALMCAKRYTGLVDSFPSGDWLFQQVGFYTIGVGSDQVNFNGICFGDVDGSYNPTKSNPAGVSLMELGEVPAGNGRVDIPVSASADMNLGAVSLSLKIPAGYRVENVRMSNEGGSFVWNVRNGELRIAWFGLEPLMVEAGSPLLLISASYMLLPEGKWEILPNSSMADPEGNPFSQASLSIPEISPGHAEFHLGDNYPNPFNARTMIPYFLPEKARVSISLLNLLGEEVLDIYDGEQDEGRHEVSFNADKLAPGVYHYRLSARSARNHIEQSKMLIISN